MICCRSFYYCRIRRSRTPLLREVLMLGRGVWGGRGVVSLRGCVESWVKNSFVQRSWHCRCVQWCLVFPCRINCRNAFL